MPADDDGRARPKTKADFLALFADNGVAAPPKRSTLADLEALAESHGLIPKRPVTEGDRLRTLLQLASIAVPPRASVNVLHALCLKHGLIEPEYEDVEEITVVKCGVRALLARMRPDKREQFVDCVDAMVRFVSVMMRRASLALSYHVTRLVIERPDAVVNLYRQKDTYWKNWLRMGLDAAQLPSEGTFRDVRLRLTASGDDDAPVAVAVTYDVVDEVCRTCDAVTPHFDAAVFQGAATPPFFDQVLNYAGHQLCTIVCNNAWVPLFKRLERLAKVELRAWARAGIQVNGVVAAYDVVAAVRSAAPETDGWPSVVRRWVDDVRARLLVVDGKYVADDHAFKKMRFQDAVAFNAWMQQRFRSLGTRGLRLMPVCKVRRTHVRLDAKTLFFVLKSMFPDDRVVEAVATATAKYEEMLEAELAARGFAASDSKRCGHPSKYFLPRPPPAKKMKDCDADEWDRYKASCAEHKAACDATASADWYVRLAAGHEAAAVATSNMVTTLMGIRDRRGGRTFDTSIVTDGVAISVQYSRSVRRQVVPTKKAAKKRKAKTVGEEDAVLGIKEWDRSIPTVFDDVAVLGVDPGRTNLAAVVVLYKDADGKLKRRKWSLSRGQYRHESGVRGVEKLKAAWRAPLTGAFATIATDETSLKTANARTVLEYVRRVRAFDAAWWAVALERHESVAAFNVHRGKRAVLDRFWSKVFRDARDAFGGRRLEVAYGEAGLTMSPTGRGEVAVPTCGMFKACQRIGLVYGVVVTPTDEHCSTKTSWETGVDKERVYRCLDGAGRWTLGHTAGRSTPKAPPAAEAAVAAEAARLAVRDKHRKSGTAVVAADESDNSEAARKGPVRWPEVRGLRFDPELRMYLDRDRTAAETIGRLWVYELRGWGRPEPFCRRVRTKKDGVAQAPQRDVDGDAVTDRCSQGASNLRPTSTGTCQVSQS